MTYDEKQQEVINIDKGYHLVLAPPGCGKTDLLSERISQAHSKGVDYGDMLCLTFTNRASKGMRDRIEKKTNNPVPDDLFVGNIHRYCSKFLFDNKIIPQNSAILDEYDTLSILSQCVSDFRKKEKEDLMKAFKIQHLRQQIRYGHDADILLHADLLDVLRVAEFEEERIKKSGSICEKIRVVYGFDDGLLNIARRYENYKEENDMLDFDDLLIKTYETLRHPPEGSDFHKFSWVQIDEVQDLNRLQFAIVDALLAKDPTVVYLGDEQQAIFSFMGAKLETVEWLKERCEANIHHLNKNYRSPKYLLDIYNTYAEEELGIERDLLPMANNEDTYYERKQDLLCVQLMDNRQYGTIVSLAKRYSEVGGDCTTAILVPSNECADGISRELDKAEVKHFKVSGTDVFSTKTIQAVMAHLTVIQSEIMFISWAKLLHHLGILPEYSKARDFMRMLKENALVPDDLFNERGSSYLLDFIPACSDGDIVLFDTETTGLDVYEDDIVQIAAIKIHHGEKVPGSEKVIYLKTDKDLPPIIAGKENPMIEAMKEAKMEGKVVERDAGLAEFMDYCKGSALMAHNINFDYNILDYNLKRDLKDVDLERCCPLQFDTLKLIRLLEPRLKVYKLEHLLEVLHLEGANSHNAIDDVNATYNLLNYCYKKACERKSSQEEFLKEEEVRAVATKLIDKYELLYRAGKQRLNDQEDKENDKVLLTREFQLAYQYFTKRKLVPEEKKVKYITDYLTQDLVDKKKFHSLSQQLSAYSTDLLTLREADLCAGASMTEKFFISTVYKAKGLEFDNVMVTDVVRDTYPFFLNYGNDRKMKEDARKLYVAMSRAKKRLCLIWYNEKWIISKKGNVVHLYYNGGRWNFEEPLRENEYKTAISPFVESISDFFDTWSQPGC